MVEIQLTKRDFFWIGLIVVLLGVGLAYAYGSGNPSVMGHSSNEIVVDDALCNAITGYNCGAIPSGGSVSWGSLTGVPAGFRDNVDNVGSVSISCSCGTCWATRCAGSTHQFCTPSGWKNFDGTNICGGGGS